MFEMSSVCAKIRLLTLSPSLGDGIVDNALLQTTPDVNQSRPEFVDIVDTRLLSSVHTSNMSKQKVESNKSNARQQVVRCFD